ncbi:MAG: HAMP domain-containing sensor histidine kinase [Christensenellales bacterium]|jgi:signal transduction histidine kinase
MSIRKKILLSLILVFSCLLGGINYFIADNIRSNNQSYIKEDLTAIENTGNFYVDQLLIVNNYSRDQSGFSKIAEQLAGAMGNAVNKNFAAYSPSGELLFAGNQAAFRYLPEDDLTLAIQGNSAYFSDSSQSGSAVYFSFPVFSGTQVIGILRCINDYTLLYEQGEQNRDFINIITLIGFGVCLVLSFVLSHSITSPIRKLTTNLFNATRRLQDGYMEPKQMENSINVQRRDEIGILSRNIIRIIHQINRQLQTINNDRVEILRISEYRRDFYNSITHELKTPLTSIIGYAEILRENGLSDSEFFQQGIRHISQESERMHELVVALLESSNMHAAAELPMEPVDFSALIQDICDSMRFKADKYNCRIQCHLYPAMVWGNSHELRQLVINLLDNAIKYSTGSREISLHTKSGDSNHTVFCIQNPAEAFPATATQALFAPYVQLNNAHREKGSRGLGLGICQQIVERHQGTLQLEHPEPRLVRVLVSLPSRSPMDKEMEKL